MVRALGTPVVKCTATRNYATGRRTPADAASGMETVMFLAKGAKVMLTKNLWQKVGLVNGIRGEVVDKCRPRGRRHQRHPATINRANL